MKLKKVQDQIGDRLKQMAANAKDGRAFLQRVIYPMYQEAQAERWMTENRSEGEQWAPLDPTYADEKREVFAGYAGGGRKMLIATGSLATAVIYQPRKAITKTTMVVGVDTSVTNPYSGFAVGDYAQHVADVRPFMRFGTKTKDKMRQAFRRYIETGKTA